jgi:hypothetical protein
MGYPLIKRRLLNWWRTAMRSVTSGMSANLLHRCDRVMLHTWCDGPTALNMRYHAISSIPLRGKD